MAISGIERLKQEFSDPQWRKKFVDYCNLIDVLGDCIIDDSYVPSDALNSAIVLTKTGVVMRDRLIRKSQVAPKDAILMCALTVGHDEIYIDVERTNLDHLAAAISSEIVRKRISFPFTYGRELYDKYALLFEEEKSLLTVDETLRLLDGMPFGVFQYGRYTTGPYGLKVSPHRRSVKFGGYVGAYHCAKSVCLAVHPTKLSTSQSATINRDRSKLERMLQSLPTETADWWVFADEISGLSTAYYNDERAGALIPLLGDSLTLDELRALVVCLLDETKGSVRSAIASFASVKDAAVFAKDLDRASLLQLSLFAEERDIAASLDRLVREGLIRIPRGDVRRPVVNSDVSSGAFRLRSEIGQLGVRFVSEDSGFALLRERRLLNKLYIRNSHDEIHELEWQLRGVEVSDLDERLEHFFRSTDPKTALERLVLARRSNMVAACDDVGIEHGDDLSDAELLDTLLWKMGFPTVVDEDPHSEFWIRHERLWALAQSSEIGASSRFVEHAGPYFRLLEGLLLDSLAFTTWALLNDHTTSKDPYSYDDESDRRDGLALLQAAFDDVGHKTSNLRDLTSENVTLATLIAAFRVLADHLERIGTDPAKHQRPELELPAYHGKTELKSFLFQSTVPFLSLSLPSQERILEGLRNISSMMSEADLSSVRNDYSHYRRNAPDISKVEAALDASRRSVTRIETLGFCRLLFSRASVLVDRWGQARHEFTGPRSYDHTLTRPSRYDWISLPALSEPQYLLRAASFGDQREVLRFSRRFPSSFSQMWENFPTRRRRGAGSATSDAPGQHQASMKAVPS